MKCSNPHRLSGSPPTHLIDTAKDPSSGTSRAVNLPSSHACDRCDWNLPVPGTSRLQCVLMLGDPEETCPRHPQAIIVATLLVYQYYAIPWAAMLRSEGSLDQYSIHSRHGLGTSIKLRAQGTERTAGPRHHSSLRRVSSSRCTYTISSSSSGTRNLPRDTFIC